MIQRDLNGVMLKRRGDAVFMLLPRSLWREIEGGCACDHCKAVEGRKAYWDAVAISAAKPELKRPDTTWTVHLGAEHPYRLERSETQV